MSKQPYQDLGSGRWWFLDAEGEQRGPFETVEEALFEQRLYTARSDKGPTAEALIRLHAQRRAPRATFRTDTKEGRIASRMNKTILAWASLIQELAAIAIEAEEGAQKAIALLPKDKQASFRAAREERIRQVRCDIETLLASQELKL